MSDTMTIAELTAYIENFIRMEMRGQPYSFDLTDGTVRAPDRNYRIIIPPVIVNDIRLEEI